MHTVPMPSAVLEKLKDCHRKLHTLVLKPGLDGLIGYGRNLNKKPLNALETHELFVGGIHAPTMQITVVYAEFLLDTHIRSSEKKVLNMFSKDAVWGLSHTRHFALVMMHMLVGHTAMLRARLFRDAVETLDWHLASVQHPVSDAESTCNQLIPISKLIRHEISYESVRL